MRSSAALGVTTIAVLLAACTRPTAAPVQWAPAPDPVAAAPAAPPEPTTSFMGARRGDDYVVLAYATGSDALQPFGPPLPLKQPPPHYEVPRFLHIYSARPDRVFVILHTFEGYRSFGGDGTRWVPLPPQGAGGNEPHFSDDGELIIINVLDTADAEPRSMTRVMTWDGQTIDEWPYQERATFGFVEHGQRWITQSRDDEQKLVHTAGAEPRAYAGEKWFDPQAGGTSRDRYRIKNGVATDQRTGEVAARFLARTLEDTSDSHSYVAGAVSHGDRGIALMKTIYFEGWCYDHLCPVASALDLWTFGPGGPEDADDIRLFLSTDGTVDTATAQATVATTGAHVLWFRDQHTAAAYDIATETKRTLPTDYELLLIQSPRR